jgi:ABC-2 type transport system permease protein
MKTMVVAKSEFLTAVRSKGFIIGVLMMPIAMAISFLVQGLSEKHADVSDRVFAIVDPKGVFADALTLAADKWNGTIDDAKPEARRRAKYVPTRVDVAGRSTDEVRLDLSDKIRKGELFAFVEIPEDALGDSRPNAPGGGPKIVYYSDKPTEEDLRYWIAKIVNTTILGVRLKAAGIEQSQYDRLAKELDSEHRGLTSRTLTGEIKAAAAVDRLKTYFIPLILMFLLWMVVMSAVPQLLSTAIEEKMIRVSEVILGSVTPFELMMGKLIASTGISAVLAFLYLTGGVIFAVHSGRGDAIPVGLLPYFVLFLLLAVFFFGSVFIAIGAACSEIKDAQGLMAPAMIILMLPMFVWLPVLKQPNSTLAVVSSLFPPATPMLMLLRLAAHPPPPLWQVLLGIVLTSATTIGMVWAAGRIFRIGILSQGKTPGIRELIRWVTKA